MVPNGWELTCLGDVASTTMGYAFKSKDFVESGIPLIRMGNLYQNKLDLDRSPIFLPNEFSVEYERFLLKSGDLIMSMTGTMGKRDYGFTVQIPKGTPDCLLNQRVMKFDNKANSDLEYLKYLLRSELLLARLYAFPGGTKQANLSAKQVCEIPVYLPTLPEQHKIAKILSTWDKAISTTEKLIETSKQQKKALMQQLLTGKKRLVNPETGKAFEGEWEEVKLDDILQEFINGNAFSASNYKSSGIPIITMGNIGLDGSFNERSSKANFWDEKEELSKYIIRKGDLLIAMTDVTPDKNLIGRMTIVNIDKTFYLNQRVGLLRLMPNISSTFIRYLSNELIWRKYSIAVSASGVQANMSTKDIKKGVMRLPSFKEQQKISSVLTAVDKEIEVLEAKLAHLKQEKKALMQQLLTGKRRVSLSS